MAAPAAEKPAQEQPKPFVEREKAESQKSRDVFAQEMHFQCYRIENLFKTTDKNTVMEAINREPSLVTEPLLSRFLAEYKADRTNQFIEEAKGKTEAEREKLLEGIRRVLYKAKAMQKEAEVKAKVETEEEKKAKEEAEKEAKNFEAMMKKDLTEGDLNNIETDLSKPLDTNKGQLDMAKVHLQYKTIIMGQKALGTYAVTFQKKAEEADKLMKSLESKKSAPRRFLRKHLGIVDWLGRKIASGARYVGISDSKPDTDAINEKLKPIKKYFAQNIDRVKKLRFNIDNRAKEIKDGLGVYRGDIRERLKELIGRADWTNAMKIQKEENKKQIEIKKKELQLSLQKAKEQGDEIDDAKKNTTGLGAKLKLQTERIQGGESALDDRIKAVQERLKKLEDMYGKEDPRVLDMRKDVLIPLLEGKDTMAKVKNGTKTKLSETEERNQKLDLVKSNVYLQETQAVADIEKLELASQLEDNKIELLSKQRVELGNLIEGTEHAYSAIDQFKESVSKNLDKMTKDNGKYVDGLDKQNKVIQSLKSEEPGIGTSLLKDTFIVLWVGTAVEYGINKLPGYAACWLNGKGYDKEMAERWSFTGMFSRGLGDLNSRASKWFDKDGFYQYKPDNWFTKGLSTVGNTILGVGGSILAAGNGLSQLFHQPTKTLDSMGEVFSDWGKFKGLLKEAFHITDYEKGRYSIGVGRTGGDIIMLFFSGGTSAGSAAASALANAGKFGKAFAYSKAFVGEIGRETLNGLIVNPAKHIANFAKNNPKFTILASVATAVAILGLGIAAPLIGGAVLLLPSAGRGLMYLGRLGKSIVKGETKIFSLNHAMGKMHNALAGVQDAFKNFKIDGLIKRLEIKNPKFHELLNRLKKEYPPLLTKPVTEAAEAAGKAAAATEGATTIVAAADRWAEAGSAATKPATEIAETAAKTAPAAIPAAERLTIAELKNLSIELTQELYRATDFGTRNAIENLGKQLQAYTRGRIKVAAKAEKLFNKHFKEGMGIKMADESGIIKKFEAGDEIVKVETSAGVKQFSKDEIINTNRLALEKPLPYDLASVPVGRLERWRAKGAINKELRELSGATSKEALERIAALQQAYKELGTHKPSLAGQPVPAAAATEGVAGEIASATTETIETIAARQQRPFAPITEVGVEAAAKVSLLNRTLRALPKVYLNLLAIPFIPVAGFIRRPFKGNKGEILKASGIEAVTLDKLGEISSKINSFALRGQLYDAVKLYAAARLTAKEAGIAFELMDKSFLGYINKIMPLSAKLINDVTKLSDPKILDTLPTKVEVKLDAVTKMENEHMEVVRKMIEAEQQAKPQIPAKPEPPKK